MTLQKIQHCFDWILAWFILIRIGEAISGWKVMGHRSLADLWIASFLALISAVHLELNQQRTKQWIKIKEISIAAISVGQHWGTGAQTFRVGISDFRFSEPAIRKADPP